MSSPAVAPSFAARIRSLPRDESSSNGGTVGGSSAAASASASGGGGSPSFALLKRGASVARSASPLTLPAATASQPVPLTLTRDVAYSTAAPYPQHAASAAAAASPAQPAVAAPVRAQTPDIFLAGAEPPKRTSGGGSAAVAVSPPRQEEAKEERLFHSRTSLSPPRAIAPVSPAAPPSAAASVSHTSLRHSFQMDADDADESSSLSLAEYAPPPAGPATREYDLVSVAAMNPETLLAELKAANLRADSYKRAHEVLRRHLSASLQPTRIAALTNRIAELEGHLRAVLRENRTLALECKRLSKPSAEQQAVDELSDQLARANEQLHSVKERLREAHAHQHETDVAARKAQATIAGLETMVARLNDRAQADAARIEKLSVESVSSSGQATPSPTALRTAPLPRRELSPLRRSGVVSDQLAPLQSSSFMDKATLLATKRLNDEMIRRDKERSKLLVEVDRQRHQIEELKKALDAAQARPSMARRTHSEARLRTAASRSPSRGKALSRGGLQHSASESSLSPAPAPKKLTREEKDALQELSIATAAARRLRRSEERAKATLEELGGGPPRDPRRHLSPPQTAQEEKTQEEESEQRPSSTSPSPTQRRRKGRSTSATTLPSSPSPSRRSKAESKRKSRTRKSDSSLPPLRSEPSSTPPTTAPATAPSEGDASSSLPPLSPAQRLQQRMKKQRAAASQQQATADAATDHSASSLSAVTAPGNASSSAQQSSLPAPSFQPSHASAEEGGDSAADSSESYGDASSDVGVSSLSAASPAPPAAWSYQAANVMSQSPVLQLAGVESKSSPLPLIDEDGQPEEEEEDA